jgi:hypothetical protein
MKKLLLILAVAGFAACNNASESTETKDTTVVAPVDTVVAPVDTTVVKVDTTAAPDTSKK